MCSKCQDILIGYSIPHTRRNCPLLVVGHCAICCQSGHTTEECPDHETKAFRAVQFVEQLIPSSMLEHYKITSRTPVASSVAFPKVKYEPVWEIEDTDKAIRQVLRDNSIEPSGRMKENRRLLKVLSEENHRKLVYIASK